MFLFRYIVFRVAIIVLLIIAGITISSSVYAQKKVKLKKADVWKGGKRGDERYQRLLGNVIFTQNETTIYCDSAYYFKKRNSFEGFGRVHITEGDSIDIVGRKLEYSGDTKIAKLRTNVIFKKKGTATLYTDFLDYNRNKNLAYYYNGGKLVDSANTLNSSKGYYNLNNNMASFKKNVKVVNPDYTMYSDSLQYNTRTKLIYFVAKTKVINKDSSVFEYEKGVYNTVTRVSDIKQGTGESPDYSIVGDQYDLDALRNIAKVRGNVVMRHKKEQLIIYGQASDHFKSIGLTKIYNKAYIAKVTDKDTLFMSADTLVSIDNADPAKKRLLAYPNVKIFKTDLQGTADSLEYRTADSTIYFYNKPVLWTENNQLTADSIRMLIKNNTINKIFLVANAFVISQDTTLNFNQIKGRKMTADFNNSKISKVFVQGNGESLYYALDDKTNLMMGVNKIICSNIIIRFQDGRVNNLSFLVKPEANFIPPHELKKEDMTLKGFSWQFEKKPTRQQVVQK